MLNIFISSKKDISVKKKCTGLKQIKLVQNNSNQRLKLNFNIYNMYFHDQRWKDAEVGFCGTLQYMQ